MGRKAIIRRTKQRNVNEVREMDYFSRCSFLIDIMQFNHHFKVSILLEWVRRPHLNAIQAPKAVRPSSVAPPPVQGPCVIINSCRVSDSHANLFSGTKRLVLTSFGARDPCTRSWNPYVIFLLLFDRKIEGWNLDDQDPSSLRPTHSTSTGSSDSAGGLRMIDLQLTWLTSF